MKDLHDGDVHAVSGGSATGGIVMGIAGAHASGVVGLGVGVVAGGPVGAIAGYAAGAALGGLIAIGFSLATAKK